MSKYIISILLLLAPIVSIAQDDEEDTNKPVTDTKGLHQLSIGIDIAQPITNAFSDNRTGYEAMIDYYFGKELYGVAEGGFGKATVDYTDLRYKSSNTFFRLGVNKSILVRLSDSDWDMGFIGIRYGLASIKRSQGTYTIVDDLFGNTTGTVPAKNFLGHWVEITGGMRLELFAGISAGWTIRGKFLMNAKAFKELSPSYVAGYGKGDKNSVFDYNFYLTYAIRWNKKKAAQPAPVAPAKE